jgi:hypothetical protein
MPTDRGSGPARMDGAELDDWLATRPTGALCVVRADGQLHAIPARVVSVSGSSITVGVTELGPLAGGVDACLVADRFESYEGIRGLIARGEAREVGRGAELVVRSSSTFSFERPDAGGTEGA